MIPVFGGVKKTTVLSTTGLLPKDTRISAAFRVKKAGKEINRHYCVLLFRISSAASR